jgi:hypothetical protein
VVKEAATVKIGTAQRVAGNGTAPEGLPLRDALRALGLLVAPTTLVTALLYYFGRISSAAYFSYFAVQQSALGFSPTDYLLRSADPMVRPLVALAVVAMVAIAGHSVLMRLLRRPRGRSIAWLPSAIALVGLLIFVQGVGGPMPVPRQFLPYAFLFPPLYLAAGLLLVTYGVFLRSQILAVSDGQESRASQASWATRSLLALVGLLTLFFLFVAVTRYAEAYGRTIAVQTGQHLFAQTSVVVYSSKSLSIEAKGVREDPLPAAGTYHYRYRGLRLLAWANSNYFLVPEGWADERLTIVLAESTDLRVELVPSNYTVTTRTLPSQTTVLPPPTTIPTPRSTSQTSGPATTVD